MHLGPHVGLEDRGGDLRVAGHADRLADVVAEARHHHLVVGAVALGAGGRLAAVGELVGGEAVGDVAPGSAACRAPARPPGPGSGPSPTPITAHCSAVDSSMLRKLVTAVMAEGYAGNPARRLLRHRAMRIPTALVAGLPGPRRSLGGGCSDDDTPVTAGDDPTAAAPSTTRPTARDVEVPDRPPDLVGTITSVAPFVPITEDCTPPEDLDPDARGVERRPAGLHARGQRRRRHDPRGGGPGRSRASGRKISFTVTSDSADHRRDRRRHRRSACSATSPRASRSRPGSPATVPAPRATRSSAGWRSRRAVTG